MLGPKNNDPFKIWNSHMYKDDPFAPHNGIESDNPFKPWNDPMGDESDLTMDEKRSYNLREDEEDDY